MRDINKKPGNRLRQARKELDLNQADIAEKVGLSRGHLSNIQTGKTGLTAPVAIAIEYKIGISKIWLFTGKGRMLVKTYNELKKEISDLAIDIAELEKEDQGTLIEIIRRLRRAWL